jgi:HSP20 family protein
MFIVPVARHAAPFSRVFDHLFEHAVAADSARKPALDVSEADAQYVVKVDLPGVAKEDVKISIDGKRVGIEAQSRAEKEDKEGEQIVYRERLASSYARSFTLPQEIDQEASNAKLEHGVLTLSLAKRQASSAARLTVN